MVCPAQIPSTNIQNNRQTITKNSENMPRQPSSMRKGFAFRGRVAGSCAAVVSVAFLRENRPMDKSPHLKMKWLRAATNSLKRAGWCPAYLVRLSAQKASGKSAALSDQPALVTCSAVLKDRSTPDRCATPASARHRDRAALRSTGHPHPAPYVCCKSHGTGRPIPSDKR